jgi:hypothetical protein
MNELIYINFKLIFLFFLKNWPVSAEFNNGDIIKKKELSHCARDDQEIYK